MMVASRRRDAPRLPAVAPKNNDKRFPLQTLDEMLSRNLLSTDQHGEIRAWIADVRTPEAILAMPTHLWRALELASVLMGFEAEGDSTGVAEA